MRYVYLGLVALGIYLPWRHFYAWFEANGWDLGPMIDAWYVNEATTALTWDLTIAALALVIWVAVEVVRNRDWLWLIVVPVTFGIGVSAGLPLALFLMTIRRKQAS